MKNKILDKKDWLIIGVAVAIFAVIVIGVVISNINARRYVEEHTKSHVTYHMTREECAALEKDIADFLAKHGLWEEQMINVKVSSGYVNADGTLSEEVKNKVYVFLSGSLADTDEEERSLAEGYHAAMILFLGENEMKRYDIEVCIAGGNDYLNGVLVETET